jgi:hypothetical protein
MEQLEMEKTMKLKLISFYWDMNAELRKTLKGLSDYIDKGDKPGKRKFLDDTLEEKVAREKGFKKL